MTDSNCRPSRCQRGALTNCANRHQFYFLVGDPGLEPRHTGSKPALLANYSNPQSNACSTEFHSDVQDNLTRTQLFIGAYSAAGEQLLLSVWTTEVDSHNSMRFCRPPPRLLGHQWSIRNVRFGGESEI